MARFIIIHPQPFWGGCPQEGEELDIDCDRIELFQMIQKKDGTYLYVLGLISGREYAVTSQEFATIGFPGG